jgi:histidinol dehydrogenase
MHHDVKPLEVLTHPSPGSEERIKAIIRRGRGFDPEDTMKVSEILSAVENRGDAALLDYCRRFDAPDMAASELVVSDLEIDLAEREVEAGFSKALDRAVAQISDFHRRQVKNSWFQPARPEVFLGQMTNPVQAAGVYVPGARGGMTPLVSSVLMGGIPARIAGVDQVVMTTPPRRDGSVDPHLLVAAKRVGIDRVFRAGSAWAVAGLAYGTETIPAVDVIVGPGNIYVTIAKKLVSGTVGIDMIAGPSEILVIADRTARPAHISADLLSQAEHDVLASALLITDSKEVAEETLRELAARLEALSRKEIAEKALRSYGAILVVRDLEAAIELANRIAPEHLELLVADPFSHVGRIRSAGAVFMGHYTPEPMGDYVAGPNHVLPTGGTARFSSALSVDTFMKQTSLIYYSQKAMEREAGDVIRLAEIEGLGAHAESVRVRQKKK